MAKDKDYKRMIHTARWLRLRRDVLTDHPLCVRCKTEGRLRSATEVHHVVPVERALTLEEKERLMFDRHNLQALCHDCHVRTHTEMGRGGKRQAEARRAAQLKAWKERFG
ncbi:HNH endonuclease [gut metagenome]|uniref:HNH endonuclease n=1 Tax=gut metagenome TaxID=749906 RepID=J9FGG8_9ZZZZ